MILLMPMPPEKKEFGDEVIVVSVRSTRNNVILDLKFTKPRVEESSGLRPEVVIEPLHEGETERMVRQVTQGTIQALQQAQRQMRGSFPPVSPFDIIRIVLSKEKYIEMGRPTVDDKLTLKLRMK